MGQGTAPDGDVVRLGTREIMKRERELAILDPSEITLDSVGESNARLGRSVSEDGGHLGQFDEVIEHRHGILGAEEDVEVADRLGAPSQAPADLGS